MKFKITRSALIILVLICNYNYSFAQAGEWTWINGSNTVNFFGDYGTQGVTSPTNHPPSLGAAFEWTDLNGNFWLFGGRKSFQHVYGDLWKYDPLINQWAWMKGTQQSYWDGDYGTQGVSAPTNNPPCRHDGARWVDLQGNLWLFGGIQSAGVRYSDLWKYDITLNEWIWVKGPDIPTQNGIYGIRGVPSPNNNPSARYSCTASWTDNAGDLWLFGGNGGNILNDMWRYNISTNQWTWMKGSPSFDPPGIFGIKGVEDSLNVPSGRSVNASWKDVNGNFWIFGGIVNSGVTNQLWRFNPVTNNWTWMSGDSTNNSSGSTGIVCVDSITNKPSANRENRATWNDNFGNLLFYGGIYGNGAISHFWKYCLSDNQWTIQKPIGTVSWGTLGIPSSTNTPGVRYESNAWKDNSGNLYLYGGSNALSQSYGDLWKFVPDSSCGSCTPTVGVSEINYNDKNILIFPNPGSGIFTIQSPPGQLQIFNSIGKLIFSKEVNEEETTVDISAFSDGIYLVILNSEVHSLSHKILLSR